MGIAFGLGVVFGVRAVNDGLAGVVPVILLLVATAVVSATNVRTLCLFAAVGSLLGAGAGLRTASADDTTLLPYAPTGVIAGEVRTDVDVLPSGGFTTISWRAADGVERESRVILPPAPFIGRGDRIEVLVDTVEGAAGEFIVAERVRVVRRAGWIEQRRRAIRGYLSDTIQYRVPGTPGALTLGLLIGDDTALTQDERDHLRRAGLSHLTAVSGWNVTLVISAVGLLFLRLGL
ncbi:MAG TPA: ComEC/Rec2 family competence protein, partial [Thermomicrobiales bacterium]|nr:ComEC/Rec2 family competence protein [Thermomicrobiales bacterium]